MEAAGSTLKDHLISLLLPPNNASLASPVFSAQRLGFRAQHLELRRNRERPRRSLKHLEAVGDVVAIAKSEKCCTGARGSGMGFFRWGGEAEVAAKFFRDAQGHATQHQAPEDAGHVLYFSGLYA